MKNIFLPTLLAALAVQASDTNQIPAITVTASSQTAEHADIHEVLRTEPGVVLNSQGGSQNDLSIRGSSFSGAGLSLGGLKLSNPQTEHFNAELPVPATMLSRPDIRTGLDNQGGHLVGTVGFDLLPISGKKQVEAGFGTDHRDWQSLLLQHMLTENLGMGVFAGQESASGVDYPDNDYDRQYVGAHMQFRNGDTRADLLISHQQKEFGARGYYGANPLWGPPSEETEDTLIFLSAMKGDLNADYLRGGISWRTFRDYYAIPSGDYWNRHRSRNASAFIDGRTIEINGWSLGWRGDIEEERITSTGYSAYVPGPWGLGNHHRTRGGVSVLPQWRSDRWKITIGARSEFFSEESAEFLPQLGAEFMLSDNLTAFASYSESVRQPSYVELNYNSQASLGNMGLGPQTAAQTEIGMKGTPSEFMDWEIAAFHRRTKNTIDWTKASSSNRWTATDIGTLDTYGLEAELGWYPADNIEAQFSYTWTYKDRTVADDGGYSSRYALDYPEHLAQAALLWRPFQALEIGTVQAVRIQTANNVRENGDLGFDSSFVVRFTPPEFDYATLSLLLNNAWDDDFQPLPGQRAPERYAGISLTLDW